MYVLVPMVWLRASTMWLKPISVSSTNGAVWAMPSRNKVAPAGAASKVRWTFCGKIITELVDYSPLEFGDREADAIPGEAAKIMPRGRDRERAARHAGDGDARMHVPLVQEVDVPGVGARGQRAILHVGRAATEADDVTRLEEYAISRGENGCRRPSAGTDAQRC